MSEVYWISHCNTASDTLCLRIGVDLVICNSRSLVVERLVEVFVPSMVPQIP